MHMAYEDDIEKTEAAWEDYEIPEEWTVEDVSGAESVSRDGITLTKRPIYMVHESDAENDPSTIAWFLADVRDGQLVKAEIILSSSGEVIGKPGEATQVLLAASKGASVSPKM